MKKLAMSDEKQAQTDSDIIWKGSTVLLTVILALALVSWVGERKSLIAKSSHASPAAAIESAEVDEDAIDAIAAEADQTRAALEKSKVNNVALKQRVQSLSEQLTTVGGERGKLDERIASTSKERSALTRQLTVTREALARVERTSRSGRADLVRIEEHRDSLLQEKKLWAASSRKMDTTLTDKLTKYNSQISALRTENASKTALLELKTQEALDRQALQVQLRATGERAAALEQQLQRSKDNATRLSGVVDAKREQLEETLRELAEADADSEELAKAKKKIVELEKTSGRQQQLRAQVETMSRKNSLAYEAQIKDLKNAEEKSRKSSAVKTANLIRDLRASRKAEGTVANRLRKEVQDLRAQNTRMTEELDIVKTAMAKAKDTPEPVMFDVVVVDGSNDLIGANKILSAQVKKTNAEIRRVNIDREALIEEYKRSSDRIRKQLKKIEELEAKLSKIN
jgi:chromosome segregation ATPase